MTRLLLLLAAALLAGCASTSSAPTRLYDFGPLPAQPAAAAAPARPIIVAEVSGPAMLDTQMMVYRLNYADALEARPYANSHWSATPLQLITQRLKARLAQSGATVLSVTDAAAASLLLRVEVDEFVHSFDNASASAGELALRASLFDGHTLIAQRAFRYRTPATSADAAGGARALAASTDAASADIMAWIAALPPRP